MTKYVDPAATGGNNDGSSWANAWVSLLDAVAGTNQPGVPANEDIFCRGSETTVSIANFSQVHNSDPATPLRIIGVNASGVEDGTRYTVNNVTSHILNTGADNMQYHNIEVVGGSNLNNQFNGFSGIVDYADGIYFKNCRATNLTTGFRLDRNRYYVLENCIGEGCGDGARGGSGGGIYSSVFRDNRLRGWYATQQHRYCNSWFINNLLEGCFYYSQSMVANCVAHGNGVDGFAGNYTEGTVIGCRATNNTRNGFNAPNTYHHHIDCYAQGNGNLDYNVPAGNLHNSVVGSDADFGYVDSAGGNFELAANATHRKEQHTIGNTSLYMSAGLLPDDSGGGPGGPAGYARRLHGVMGHR